MARTLRNDAESSQDEEKSREEFTTYRVYKVDGKILSELAELTGLTVADIFREHCVESLRKKLVAATERRLSELKAGA